MNNLIIKLKLSNIALKNTTKTKTFECSMQGQTSAPFQFQNTFYFSIIPLNFPLKFIALKFDPMHILRKVQDWNLE